MRKLITSLVIMALLLTLAPAVVYAAPGEVTADAKGGNTAPTVDALTLVQVGSDTVVTAMTPLSTYRVKATVGDINTIDDITEIEFHVYHTSDGAQSASTKWDADEAAIFKWTKDGNVWSMENGGATTTWEIVTANCSVPLFFNEPTGVWYLGFKPGKLAQYDVAQNWHAWVRADDENKNGAGSTEDLSAGATMGAYIAISLDSANITFGDAVNGIEPGQTGYISSPNTYITTQVVANKAYALASKSDSAWYNGGDNITLSGTVDEPPSGAGEFTLIIDDETAGLPGQPKFATQAVTTNDVTITGHSGDAAPTTVDDAAEGTSDLLLYMALALSETGVDEITYSGTITFTATN